MKWRLLACLVIVPAGQVEAEGVLYRCRGSDGITVFQDAPCPAGSTERGATAYTPEPEPSASERRARERFESAQRARVQRHAGTAWITAPASGPGNRMRAQPRPGSRAHRRQQCEAARAARDAYQFEEGAHGRANDAVMDAHRAHVQRVCHGF
jgi:hypothetical protein